MADDRTAGGPGFGGPGFGSPGFGGTVLAEPLELLIGGMSCAACAGRVERRLAKLDGVTATVNYATGRAYVTARGGRDAAELITAVEAAGYSAALPEPVTDDILEPDHGARALLVRLAACAPLALPVVVLAMVPSWQFESWQWLCLALCLPVAVWGAWPLHRAAVVDLRHAAATMNTLVSLGVAASLGWSLYALTLGGAGHLGMRMPFAVTLAPAGGQTLYLDVASGVTVTVLAGRYLETRARHYTGSALTALARLGAKTVAVVRDGTEQRVDVGTLAVGELFVVRPGEKVATDGVVVDGESALDMSMLSGESVPVEAGPGDRVTGATLNIGGKLLVRATRVGADTQLARMTKLVAEAQAGKAAAQQLADRVAGVFVPCVITLAVVTLGFWLGTGIGAGAACGAAFAVLVVACPCALGLATPAALLVGVGRGAELGILIKGVHALEAVGRVRAIVLDKTGTLTTGTMTLAEVVPEEGVEPNEALRLAGAVEDASEHPVGQAVARVATVRLGALPAMTGFVAHAGAGVTGTVDGHDVAVGSVRFLSDSGIAITPKLAAAVEKAETAGRTAVLVGCDGRACAVLVVADTLKPGSAAGVTRLRKLGLRPVLLTGDHPRAAAAVAESLGIPAEDVHAGVRPEGKIEVVRTLRASGTAVAMVGDGVNDAAALAEADLGMAMGTGTDAAIGAADLTLVRADPWTIGEAVLLARATLGVIRTNLVWAFGYNIVAIPLAALGYLNPLFAGVAMAGSSLLVVSNSLRLRGFRGGAGGGHVLPTLGTAAESPAAARPVRSRRPSRLA